MIYLKMDSVKSEEVIKNGLEKIFGAKKSKFTNYTNPIEDEKTGDKYWCIENRQYNGAKHDIEAWLDANYPVKTLARYEVSFVKNIQKEQEEKEGLDIKIVSAK